MTTTQEEQEIIGDFQKVAMRRGEALGLEKGIQQGIEQGMQQGILKNRESVALKMLAEGFDDALIAKFTDLTAQEIAALKTKP